MVKKLVNSSGLIDSLFPFTNHYLFMTPTKWWWFFSIVISLKISFNLRKCPVSFLFCKIFWFVYQFRMNYSSVGLICNIWICCVQKIVLSRLWHSFWLVVPDDVLRIMIQFFYILEIAMPWSITFHKKMFGQL